jgi:hypothetical protein
MNQSLYLAIKRYFLRIPSPIWRSQIRAQVRENAKLDFMTPEHHLIRNYVVEEIPRAAQPLPPEFIAQSLNLPLQKVVEILDDLERNMTFLYRDKTGAVQWAYPVTAERTPHQVCFSTGEQISAA